MPFGASTLSDDCWVRVCAFLGGPGMARAAVASAAVRSWVDCHPSAWRDALRREFCYEYNTAADHQDTNGRNVSGSSRGGRAAVPSGSCSSAGGLLSENSGAASGPGGAALRRLFGHLATARVCAFGV